MELKPLIASEVNAYFEFVVPRAGGDVPKNYMAEGTLDERGEISLVAYRVAATLARTEHANLPLSLLMTGFCMGREFEAWKREMDSLADLEKSFGPGPV